MQTILVSSTLTPFTICYTDGEIGDTTSKATLPLRVAHATMEFNRNVIIDVENIDELRKGLNDLALRKGLTFKFYENQRSEIKAFEEFPTQDFLLKEGLTHWYNPVFRLLDDLEGNFSRVLVDAFFYYMGPQSKEGF